MKMRAAEKQILGWVGLLAYASGVLLFILDHWVRVATPFGEAHHPVEHWTREIHTALTYLVVLAIGYLIHAHILPGLRARERKRVRSGLGCLAHGGFLLASAVGILYAGDGNWERLASWSHSLVGILSPGLILFHSAKRDAEDLGLTSAWLSKLTVRIDDVSVTRFAKPERAKHFLLKILYP